jgi:hypothetical protein
MDSTLNTLQQQLACYRKLAQLAQIQHSCVEQNRTKDLMTILAQRQGVLDEIADLEQVIGPAKRRWTEYLGELAPNDRGVAESMMAETRKLLAEITAADTDDSLILQQRKLNVGRDLQRAAVAQRVNRTYAAAAYVKRPASMDLHK